MKGIKNVIIDLGGVMIDLDRDRCVREFEALGIQGADEMLGLYRQKEPFLSIETGSITVADFYDRLRLIAGKNIDDKLLEEAFYAFLADLPADRLAALRRMRDAGLKLYMISNTNVVMYDGWIKRAFMKEGLRVGDYFDGIITSFAEGFCKPDPQIFNILLNRYSLDPRESILLDDSDANCEEARRLSMQALRIADRETLLTAAERLCEQAANY